MINSKTLAAWNMRLLAILFIALGILGGQFLSRQQGDDATKPFRLGLDLQGGSYLVYTADISSLPDGQVTDSLAALRDVIERRINVLGVSEPRVSIEESGFGKEEDRYRVVIELPGVTDLEEAKATIGETPLLEFRLENPDFDAEAAQATLSSAIEAGQEIDFAKVLEDQYVATDLTGKYLKRARVDFPQGLGGSGTGPVVALEFDKEGGDLFAQITRENVNKTLAIFLDGGPISTPNIQQEITGGEAIITGTFTANEAKELVGRLNSGALPVPITLSTTETIGASLGVGAIQAGLRSAVLGFLVVALVLLLWYRLAGLLATIALALYGVMMLILFVSVPVTLTASGLVGFIVSLGIAVDANVLIFERLKEELRGGRHLSDAIREGFARAWPSIRDANVSSLISALILFWFGSSLIQGFALVFGLGVLVSMLSAVIVSRVLLYAVAGTNNSRAMRFLYSSGLMSGKETSEDK